MCAKTFLAASVSFPDLHQTSLRERRNVLKGHQRRGFCTEHFKE